MTTNQAPSVHVPKLGRNEVRIAVNKDKVAMRIKTATRTAAMDMEWQAALDVGNALWRMSRMAEDAIKANLSGGAFDTATIGKQTTVMLRGTVIVLHVGHHDVLACEWQVARGIGGHLIHHAHRAETFAMAHLVIDDQALLIRRGVGIGLVTTPDMMAEAEKEAQHNAALRRYIPIPHYAEQVGFPSLPNPKGARNGERDDDNMLAYAKAQIHRVDPSVGVRIRKLLAHIASLHERSDALHVRRANLKEEANAVADEMSADYVELTEIVPPNPNKPQTVG